MQSLHIVLQGERRGGLTYEGVPLGTAVTAGSRFVWLHNTILLNASAMAQHMYNILPQIAHTGTSHNINKKNNNEKSPRLHIPHIPAVISTQCNASVVFFSSCSVSHHIP